MELISRIGPPKAPGRADVAEQGLVLRGELPAAEEQQQERIRDSHGICILMAKAFLL
jgi:hypothetical protein